MNKKNILLLTLVHPDFLPPVYAVAQVLRDLEYNITILTFDSFVPAATDIGPDIRIESIGKHYDSGLIQRLRLRNTFMKRARGLAKENVAAIISFCPFSFMCGLSIKKRIPLMYIALEISDFILFTFLKSPLSNFRNLLALRNIHKADLVATPSFERSAWLAGRCHLDFMPATILNTTYITEKKETDTLDKFKEIVPEAFFDKKIILYTGAVNSEHCIAELMWAFDQLDDPQSALIITGVKDTLYCNDLRILKEKCKSKDRMLLFPYITRPHMLALQTHAHIGVCLEKESRNDIRSKMMASNKSGEYLAKDLYILGTLNEYLRPLELKEIATLAKTADQKEIYYAIKKALVAINDPEYKTRIRKFVREYFCMQQQLAPVIKYLNEH